MWIQNPELIKHLTRQTERELIEKAHRARLLAEARQPRPGLHQRLLGGMGEILIRAGQRLQRYVQAAADPRLALELPGAEGVPGDC